MAAGCGEGASVLGTLRVTLRVLRGTRFRGYSRGTTHDMVAARRGRPRVCVGVLAEGCGDARRTERRRRRRRCGRRGRVIIGCNNPQHRKPKERLCPKPTREYLRMRMQLRPRLVCELHSILNITRRMGNDRQTECLVVGNASRKTWYSHPTVLGLALSRTLRSVGA
jgi:hypothetical protein